MTVADTQLFSDDQLQKIRSQFPSLSRQQGDQQVIYMDGPAGAQVPQIVADRVSHVLLHHSANRSGKFETSREVDALFSEAQQAAADLLGSADRDEIVFGPNMTTLTFHFSRAIAKTWKEGDEIVVTRLDHDGNVTPWVLAARDAGVTVRYVELNLDDCTLNLDDFRSKLNDRTRLVAITCASNSVGSRTPIVELVKLAKQFGALTYLDAVHFTPHALPDAQNWGCDFIACSAYKFYGPHIGIVWGKKSLLESIQPYKLRPSPNTVPARWMTGTQNIACIEGTRAAIDYLASLSSSDSTSRRQKLLSAFSKIESHESALVWRLIDGLKSLPGIHLYGITDRQRAAHRVPTIAFTLEGVPSAELATWLGEHAIYAWHGNYYALQLSETLQREPEGMLRMGVMHYNSQSEIDRVLNVMSDLVKKADTVKKARSAK